MMRLVKIEENGEKIMITAAQTAAVAALDLPFALDDAEIARSFTADGQPIPRSERSAEAMHARATELAHAAMEAVSPTAEEVAAFRAERQAEEDAIRAASGQRHAALLASTAAAAAVRREERLANHRAHIEALKQGRQARRADNVARHQASNDDRRTTGKAA